MKLTRAKTQLGVLIVGLMLVTGLVTWAIASKHTSDANKKNALNVQTNTVKINNYLECKSNNASKILETYPLQCVTSEGVTFTDPSVVKPIISPTTVTPSSTPKPTSTPAKTSIKDLMADVACRTAYLADKELVSTDEATVEFADLNGDSIQDALIGLRVEGTGKYGIGCVYSVDDTNTLKLLWRIPATSVLAKGSFKVGSSASIIYTGLSGSGTGPDAAQTPDTTYTYKWTGSTFSKQ